MNKNNNDKYDELCLHLAVYLASFGMYRNSFLLENDYKVHNKVVAKLCSMEDKYWHFDPFKMSVNELDDEIFVLTKVKKETLSSLYIDIKKETRMNSKNNEVVTDTLISKVLMGTLGCVPAYDERFKKGLKIAGLKQRYTKQNLCEIIEFIKNNKFENDIYKFCNEHKVYTPMRVIDMYFWGLS